MKLISMTDFVLSMVDKQTALQIANRCVSYAKFLKQPLTLGMFVPCDEDGNVLAEPESYGLPVDRHNQGCHITEEHDIYYESKERVLFDDLSLQHAKWLVDTYTLIEDITSIQSSMMPIYLTPYALKQIGL